MDTILDDPNAGQDILGPNHHALNTFRVFNWDLKLDMNTLWDFLAKLCRFTGMKYVISYL